ncbi:DUF4395 domain-containing protein [Actinokineospora iranica]|uniref:DUF4395 domain-containing protein n=1 Tax=Actinokineospora iranica TaxID=1271860 RepID=A0A1G6QCQ4_9PSEU|nr:DUF4395 domain-containing protein [Actinokineospora iranica]SDC89971.1 protein of unknown function [Actinokineospora iranica]
MSGPTEPSPHQSAQLAAQPSGRTVDPRGPRFAAWVTTAVLVAVLVTGWWPLLAAQAVVFALGAFAGPRHSPYSVLYRVLVAPRLAPTDEREDVAPLRFAQGVGFGFAVVGVLGYASGLVALGVVATAFALAAAFLNAAFGFCLGCEAYLLLNRLSIINKKVGTAR